MDDDFGPWLPRSALPDHYVDVFKVISRHEMCHCKRSDGFDMGMAVAELWKWHWDQLAEFRVRADHPIYQPTTTMPLGECDGETCNRDGCTGVIIFDPEDCYCAVSQMPPCSSCTDRGMTCESCGWRQAPEPYVRPPRKPRPDPFEAMHDLPAWGIF